ncbi:hypothetical protein MJT46_016039, partial [Ovis ammon polii x Ovis aries]
GFLYTGAKDVLGLHRNLKCEGLDGEGGKEKVIQLSLKCRKTSGVTNGKTFSVTKGHPLMIPGRNLGRDLTLVAQKAKIKVAVEDADTAGVSAVDNRVSRLGTDNIFIPEGAHLSMPFQLAVCQYSDSCCKPMNQKLAPQFSEFAGLYFDKCVEYSSYHETALSMPVEDAKSHDSSSSTYRSYDPDPNFSISYFPDELEST